MISRDGCRSDPREGGADYPSPIRARKEKFARVFDVLRISGEKPVEHAIGEQSADGSGESWSPSLVVVEIQQIVLPCARFG